MVRQKVLSGLAICPSGINDKETLSALSAEASQLGATFTNDLTRSVTHLICTRAGSLKHRQVCQWNLQTPARPVHVVRPSWLAACFSSMARVPTAPHTLPPLAGLEICCSGIEPNVKENVARICADLGALYSKSLGPACTHLLCEEPTGKKYEYAVESKKIFILRPTWIIACERLKALVDESLYLLGGAGGALREDGSLGRPSIQLQENIGSDIHEVVRNASQSAEEVISKSANEEKEHLRLTDAALRSSVDKGRCESIAKTRSQSNITFDSEVRQSASVGWMDSNPGLFLDALTFYLTPSTLADRGMHGPLRAKALKLLAYGGGSLSDELTPLVNYIVIIRLPILPSKIVEIEHAQKMGATVVSLEWLEQCVVEQKVIKHDNPSLFDRIPEENGMNGEEDSQAQHHADFKSSLFQGMRCALGPLALYDSGAVAAVRQKLQRGRGKVLAYDSRGVVSSGVATHVVCGESLAAGARRLVEAARARNSHVVVVTVEWIDACLQAEQLVRVEDCVLYAPVPHETPLRDMLRSKVSVTITGHQSQDGVLNARRDILSRLARLLGAGYSERMTKGKTTHLIADGRSNSRSKKAGMAKRWGISIVNYKWLIECAHAGVVVDASDFPVGEELGTLGKSESGIDVDEQEDGENMPKSARTENITPKRARSGLDSTKKTLFTSPSTARRSPRFQQITETGEEQATEAGDKLFERFTAGLLKSSAATSAIEKEAPSPPLTRRRSTRSPSISLDAPEDDQKQWSLDASQSQMIVHRDLTPPPTPGRGLRSMPPRAAKRRRGG